jgi:hypothetical protein
MSAGWQYAPDVTAAQWEVLHPLLPHRSGARLCWSIPDRALSFWFRGMRCVQPDWNGYNYQ